MSFPFCPLPSPSVLGEGELHAISCLSPPRPAVKADAKALALTSCQPPSLQPDSTDALLCSLCTMVLGPALLKQKFSLSPAWSSTHRTIWQGPFHRHPWWTEQNLPGHTVWVFGIPSACTLPRNERRDQAFFFYAMSHNTDRSTERVFGKLFYILKYHVL